MGQIRSYTKISGASRWSTNRSGTTAVDYMLKSIGRHPLLSADQEIELGRIVQEWQALEQSLEGRPPTKAEMRVIRHGERAYRKFFCCNLRLVVNVAKKYIPRIDHLALEDLIQAGAEGLDRAVKKFDPQRGYKFSTYAYWWIRQGITREIAYHDRVIRLPSTGLSTLQELTYWVPKFHAKHGRVPTIPEIAEHCDCTEDHARFYLAHQQRTLSLNVVAQCKDDNGSELGDLIVDHDENPLDQAIQCLEADLVQQKLELLPEKSRTVISRLYGLDGRSPQTLHSLAAELGVSRQAITQQKDRGLRVLRLHLGPILNREVA